MFWGGRYGQVIDAFGHTWGVATHEGDLSPAQIEKRQAEFFAKLRQGLRTAVDTVTSTRAAACGAH